MTGEQTTLTFGSIHAARLETSERLQRVARYLSDGQWHSTRDIVYGANVIAVNTAVAELRHNGVGVECRCKGRGVYEYRRVA